LKADRRGKTLLLRQMVGDTTNLIALIQGILCQSAEPNGIAQFDLGLP
jgi:hypothetical protein